MFGKSLNMQDFWARKCFDAALVFLQTKFHDESLVQQKEAERPHEDEPKSMWEFDADAAVGAEDDCVFNTAPPSSPPPNYKPAKALAGRNFTPPATPYCVKNQLHRMEMSQFEEMCVDKGGDIEK
jgi:hypothetical protein